VKNVLPGNVFIHKAYAIKPVKKSPKSTPISVLETDMVRDSKILESRKAWLKFSRVNSLGKKYTPPLAKSLPVFKEATRTYQKGYKVIKPNSARNV
jgi:hypothetical protein